jgi:hypothetical protein
MGTAASVPIRITGTPPMEGTAFVGASVSQIVFAIAKKS